MSLVLSARMEEGDGENLVLERQMSDQGEEAFSQLLCRNSKDFQELNFT